MSRPRITAKVVRGLKMVRSLAQADLESGGAECFPDKDPKGILENVKTGRQRCPRWSKVDKG